MGGEGLARQPAGSMSTQAGAHRDERKVRGSLNMLNGGAEFVKSVEKVLASVACRIETFPPTLDEAYKNRFGDAILSGCAIEIAEGNEPGAETPSDTDIASHGIWLMQRVRDDIDDIIAALRAYQPADG